MICRAQLTELSKATAAVAWSCHMRSERAATDFWNRFATALAHNNKAVTPFKWRRYSLCHPSCGTCRRLLLFLACTIFHEAGKGEGSSVHNTRLLVQQERVNSVIDAFGPSVHANMLRIHYFFCNCCVLMLLLFLPPRSCWLLLLLVLLKSPPVFHLGLQLRSGVTMCHGKICIIQPCAVRSECPYANDDD
jgi:hypothetical protein